ncbi:MAG: PP2C family protein-serine/threonine phosphatase [Candidatus Velthaea sp.]|jgi:serine phosphatase RsbU (regulator of sigma subunit)
MTVAAVRGLIRAERGEFDERAAAPAVTSWSSAAGRARHGGDWCEVVPVSEHAVVLSVGDVAGHGAAVAGTMAVMRESLLRAIHDIHVPSDILSAINGTALRHGGGALVTAIVALVDSRRRTLTFASAGHPPPLMSTGDRHAFLAHLPADLPLGVFPYHRAANYVLTLPSDALLVLYTDGITEHDRDPVRGEAELVEATRVVYARPELHAARAIADHVLAKKRGTDDAATIALRMMPAGG